MDPFARANLAFRTESMRPVVSEAKEFSKILIRARACRQLTPATSDFLVVRV